MFILSPLKAIQLSEKYRRFQRWWLGEERKQYFLTPALNEKVDARRAETRARGYTSRKLKRTGWRDKGRIKSAALLPALSFVPSIYALQLSWTWRWKYALLTLTVFCMPLSTKSRPFENTRGDIDSGKKRYRFLFLILVFKRVLWDWWRPAVLQTVKAAGTLEYIGYTWGIFIISEISKDYIRYFGCESNFSVSVFFWEIR